MRKLFTLIVLLTFGCFFTANIWAQSVVSVQWTCAEPDSQHVSSIAGSVSAFDATGGQNFGVYSYNSSILGPLGLASQRWCPIDAGGTRLTWGNQTEPNDSQYVQFALTPSIGNTVQIDSVSMYLGAGGTTDHINTRVLYSLSEDFSAGVMISDSSFLPPRDSLGGYSFVIDTSVTDSDTLYVRVYTWYDGSPSSSKYLYVQDVNIYGSSSATVVAPTVATTIGVKVSTTTALTGGNVISNGNGQISASGVCWNTTGTPTTSDSKTDEGSVAGTFTSSLTGLTPSTTYYLRAYATNSIGTSYGAEISFTTASDLNSTFVQWQCAEPDSQGVSVYAGEIKAFGETGGKSFGVYSYNSGVTGPLGKASQRWCPIDESGTRLSWGNQTAPNDSQYVQFAVTSNTGFAFQADSVSMYLGAGGTTDHINARVLYSLSEDFSAGVMISDTSFLPPRDSLAKYSFAINTIASDSDTLYVRVYTWYDSSPSTSKYLYIQDVNIYGSASVSAVVPTVLTKIGVTVTNTTALSGGTVVADGGNSVSAYGVCWNTSGSPTISDNATTDGSGTGAFISSLSGLTAGTTYYLRAYATNAAGTGYGEEIMFMTRAALGTAFARWTCVEPDSQYVSVVTSNVSAFDEVGGKSFGVYSYNSGVVGPLGKASQRWCPIDGSGTRLSWGNQTAPNDSQYVQFALKPNAVPVLADSVTMYLGAGGTTDHINARVLYSLSEDFSSGVMISDTSFLPPRDSLGAYSFAINKDLTLSDTLYVRVYTWYDGSPSSSKYLYVQDVTIYGRTGVTDVESESSQPISYQLSQNYPNPFNPSTIIRYAIPKEGLVKITLYDILGKEVKTLVNEVKPVGSYKINFNASNLTSGVYFYRIQAGSFVQTKKMILMK